LKKQIEHQRPVKERGSVSRAVIEALQEGIGTVAPIVSYLARQGIETTGPSVSNIIQRLHQKGIVRRDDHKEIWTLTEALSQSQPDTAPSDRDETNNVAALEMARSIIDGPKNRK
jgi:predicted transcriptional regulator